MVIYFLYQFKYSWGTKYLKVEVNDPDKQLITVVVYVICDSLTN
jgi:hypothetical protein